jgi:hypothetical protein
VLEKVIKTAISFYTTINIRESFYK